MPAITSFQHLLETSRRVNWRLEDLLGEGRRLDFTRPFLPEAFAQTEPLGFLSAAEKLKLNQIRARGYLALFELFEAIVVPFISAQSNYGIQPDSYCAPALRHRGSTRTPGRGDPAIRSSSGIHASGPPRTSEQGS